MFFNDEGMFTDDVEEDDDIDTIVRIDDVVFV